MSDSTIDDALRLLEIGKGNPDRLKLIIVTFIYKYSNNLIESFR